MFGGRITQSEPRTGSRSGPDPCVARQHGLIVLAVIGMWAMIARIIAALSASCGRARPHSCSHWSPHEL